MYVLLLTAALFAAKAVNKVQEPERGTISFLTGKFDPGKHPDFSIIPAQYTNKSEIYLQTEVLNAFIKMSEHASRDGVKLQIISATRGFAAQKVIWEAKFQGKRPVEGMDLSRTSLSDIEKSLKIMRFSSMPGTSRHHWGTDFDLNALEDEYFQKGEGKRVYQWLVKNAPDYGFCQPYSAKGPGRETGYEEEKWHWSYKPLSALYTRAYVKLVSYSDLTGFEGASAAAGVKAIEHYVVGICNSCLDADE
jgi:zinc D-Ala-D-Ala carboxypeptidase